MPTQIFFVNKVEHMSAFVYAKQLILTISFELGSFDRSEFSKQNSTI